MQIDTFDLDASVAEVFYVFRLDSSGFEPTIPKRSLESMPPQKDPPGTTSIDAVLWQSQTGRVWELLQNEHRGAVCAACSCSVGP